MEMLYVQMRERERERERGKGSEVTTFLSGPQSEASASCQQLFPPEPYSHRGGSVGDLAVKTFSEMVLNDQPAQDPRWGEGRGELEVEGKAEVS